MHPPTRPISSLFIYFSRFFRPADRPVLVIFVVGGFTPMELKEVNGVLRCCAASAEDVPEVILAGTTLLTPDVTYEQVFSRPPAWQEK